MECSPHDPELVVPEEKQQVVEVLKPTVKNR